MTYQDNLVTISQVLPVFDMHASAAPTCLFLGAFFAQAMTKDLLRQVIKKRAMTIFLKRQAEAATKAWAHAYRVTHMQQWRHLGKEAVQVSGSHGVNVFHQTLGLLCKSQLVRLGFPFNDMGCKGPAHGLRHVWPNQR